MNVIRTRKQYKFKTSRLTTMSEAHRLFHLYNIFFVQSSERENHCLCNIILPFKILIFKKINYNCMLNYNRDHDKYLH